MFTRGCILPSLHHQGALHLLLGQAIEATIGICDHSPFVVPLPIPAPIPLLPTGD